MIIVSPSLVVVSTVCTILFGTILAILSFKPKLGQRIIERSKVPWAFWTQSEGSEGMIVFIIFFLFVVFSCTLCYQLYGLFQTAQP